MEADGNKTSSNSTNMTQTPQLDERQPETLLWAQYPDGRYGAVVQSDGQVVYFAIQKLYDGQPADVPSRWVWVRNLRPAPLMFAEPSPGSTRLPLMAESYCVHPKGLPALNLDRTRIVWFEQGIGAMLVEGDQVLAIVPPQPNQVLPGFSAECRQANAFALSLDDDDLYLPMAERLPEYWAEWATSKPFTSWHAAATASISQDLGQITQEFALTSDIWPPLRVAQVANPRGESFLVTIGMGLRCQPMVERELLNFTDHQRLELAVPIPQGTLAEAVETMAGWLAGLARYPWHHETCFLPTQKLSTLAPRTASPVEALGSKIELTLTAESQAAASMDRKMCRLPNYRQQTVNLIWLL
jgi:hypothetical protein